MYRKHITGLALAFLVAAHGMGSSDAQTLRETWFESRTATGKLGYSHFHAQRLKKNGGIQVRTVIREKLHFLRSGDPYSESFEHFTVETPEGEILELGYKTSLSRKQNLSILGTVEGEQMVLRIIVDGKPTDYTQTVPWNKSALGLYAVDNFFRRKNLKEGEEYRFLEFSLAAHRVGETICTIGETESTPDGPLTKAVESYARELYSQPSTIWLDKEGLVAKIEDDSPIFGPVIYTRTSEEQALAPFTAQVADIEAPIPVEPPISFRDGPPKALRVRVQMKGEPDPASIFSYDERQEKLSSENGSVEMRLTLPRRTTGGKEDTAYYLDSNFFIRSDDRSIARLAARAVGRENRARMQVQRIRAWMRRHFKGNYEIPFATADEVARTMEGDCSEMGVLAAALCRASGIPSRIVFGLVYDEVNPGFGGHLWTEVMVEGKWEPFDPTRIIDQLGAAHIKIADYSMSGVINPDTLTQVRRVFSGRMKIQVLSAEY